MVILAFDHSDVCVGGDTLSALWCAMAVIVNINFPFYILGVVLVYQFLDFLLACSDNLP